MQNNKKSQSPKFLPRIIANNNEHDFRRSPQVHIFREELHTALLPYGGRSNSYSNFHTELSGNDIDKAKCLLNSITGSDATEVNQIICEVINTLGNVLSYSGVVRYEIVESDGYCLSHIPEQSFYDLKYLFVQVVPKEQQKNNNKKFIFNRAKYVWTLTLPEKVCHWKSYRKILKGLAQNTNTTPPCVDNADLIQNSIGFNFESYNRETTKYIYKIINCIGGNQRDSRTGFATEFYIVNRELKFNLSKILIREHIIDELNSLFIRLNLDSQIVISGLPTSLCIKELISDIGSGKVGLNKALSTINIY
ncbi:hypothetical protein HHL01_10885 [Pseudoalteromonas arctica]|uniref:Uncharacterized protein n=1 Tax=Pseudoalteromonas arctica TaxID=394751 RepID=A0A7X9U7K8_9GAMM|nr:hypothetical protein [Pseudoalteromonas arctica]NMF48683.1 hypothetical protein [Pseudoalteromonas arctica]